MEFKEICSPPGRFVLFQEKVTFPEAAQVRTWTIRTFFFTYMNIWPLGLLHVSRRNSCDRNGWGLWEVLLLNTNKMAWFFSIGLRQITNFHHQRLADFLNDKGSAGNSVPRVWLRFTDISQVSLRRQHCRLTICIELVDLTVSDGKIQIRILWKGKWIESDICEGRPLGGLYNTASAFYAHSMASHLRANRIHWLGFQFFIQTLWITKT